MNGHRAAFVEADEQFSEGAETRVVRQIRVAFFIQIGRANADGRAHETVTGTIQTHGEVDTRRIAYRDRRGFPFFPRDRFTAVAGDGDARLFEQGAVDERAGDGHIRVDRAQGRVAGAGDVGDGNGRAKVGIPVIRIGQVRTHIEIIGREAGNIRALDDVRADASFQLEGQGLGDGVVGHNIQHDIDIRICRFKVSDDIVIDRDLSVNEIGHDADFNWFLGESHRGHDEKGKDDAKRNNFPKHFQFSVEM